MALDGANYGDFVLVRGAYTNRGSGAFAAWRQDLAEHYPQAQLLTPGGLYTPTGLPMVLGYGELDMTLELVEALDSVQGEVTLVLHSYARILAARVLRRCPALGAKVKGVIAMGSPGCLPFVSSEIKNTRGPVLSFSGSSDATVPSIIARHVDDDEHQTLQCGHKGFLNEALVRATILKTIEDRIMSPRVPVA